MSTIAPVVRSVNWGDPAIKAAHADARHRTEEARERWLANGPTGSDHYQQRAQATRARRQAAGRYARPTKAQKATFAKLVQPNGRNSLTVEEMGLLATHPHLTASQRAEFAAMAQQAIKSAVA